MRHALFMFSLAVSAACSSADDGSQLNVVGGTVVTEGGSDLSGVAPIMRSTVALMSPWGGLCTATIIGPNHLVTAAHCLTDGNPQGTIIGFGTVPQDRGLRVIDAVIHPSYVGFAGRSGEQDIGVVAFEGTLPEGFGPVPIAPLDGIGPGAPFIVAGYGVTSERGQDSGTLRQATSWIEFADPTSREFSQQAYKGTGSCYGDSGGPAYIDTNGTLSVIGAVSRGSNCDVGDGIYTDVRLYQGWMKCTFAALGKPLDTLVDNAQVGECGNAQIGLGSTGRGFVVRY